MRIWRVVRRIRSGEAWTPPEMDHRWNTRRYRVTYASLEPGTSVTEALVYLKSVHQFGDRVLVEGRFAGKAEEAGELPKGWDAWPHQPHVQAFGDRWLEAAKAPALMLPSAVLPARNLVLNQGHPDFAVETIAVHSLKGLTR